MARSSEAIEGFFAHPRDVAGPQSEDEISFPDLRGEEGGDVRLRVMPYRDVASLRGIAGSLKKPLSWQEMLEIAHERI